MSTRVEIDSKIVLINSISAIVERLLTVSVLVWLQQYLVRRISAEEYGIYQVVLALLLFAPLIATVVCSGLARFVTEAYAQGDPWRVRQIASTSAAASAAAGLGILLVGWPMAWQIDRLVTVPPVLVSDARWMLAILTALAALRVAVMPFSVGLHVRQKFVWIHLIGFCSELVRIAVLFSLLFGVSTRALWVVVATAPATLFEVGATVLFSLRQLPLLRFTRSAVSWPSLRPILAFGGWTVLARASTVARTAAGPLLLNRFSSAVAVTSYGLGAMVETRLFPSIIYPMITTLPMLTAMHATGQDVRLKVSYFRLTRYLAWIFLLVVAPLVIYRHELWRLYLGVSYPSYIVAATVMMLLLLKVALVFPQPAMAQIAAAKNRTRPMALRVLMIEGSAVVLASYLIVVKEWGALGPAAAALITAAIGAPPLLWTMGLELTGASFGEWWRATLRPGLIPVVAATPVWLVLRWWSNPDSWIGLATVGLAGGAVYLAVLLHFCLQEDDRGDLGRLLTAIGNLLGSGKPW